MQRITRAIEIKEKLNMTNETMSKLIGVSATAFGKIGRASCRERV